MARGQNLSLAASGSILIDTLSREQKASVAILNPNDGVVYVRLNSPIADTNVGSWDWKLPSQSYGLFPGPWQSLGIFYLDQGGAGHQGEITVYDSDNKTDVPDIHSIGRALQAQATALDIVEGTIPAFPGTGLARLWVDSTDDFHIVNSLGVDAKWVDGDDTVGGVLAGSLLAPSFAANPTFTGTLTVPAANLSGTLTAGALNTSGSISVTTANQGLSTAAGGYFIITSGGHLYLRGGVGSLVIVDSNALNTLAINAGGIVTALRFVSTANGNALIDLTINGPWQFNGSGNISGSLVATGSVEAGNWLRTNVAGQGIYNNVTATGVGLAASGSGAQLYPSGFYIYSQRNFAYTTATASVTGGGAELDIGVSWSALGGTPQVVQVTQLRNGSDSMQFYIAVVNGSVYPGGCTVHVRNNSGGTSNITVATLAYFHE